MCIKSNILCKPTNVVYHFIIYFVKKSKKPLALPLSILGGGLYLYPGCDQKTGTDPLT